MEHIIEQLAGAGYERVAQVTTRGQFAVRGGIVDLYSWQAPLPMRLEFFGDEIDSLREFDIDTQTSVRDLTSVDILLGAIEDQSSVVRDYVARDHLKIEIEPVMDGGAPDDAGLARPSSKSKSAKAGLRSVRKILAARSRIAKSASSRSVISYSSKLNARSFPRAWQSGARRRQRSSSTSRLKVKSSVFARSSAKRRRWMMSIFSKELSPVDFVFPQPISSSSRPLNYLDDWPPIRDAGCVVRNGIAHRSISANSPKAIWLFIWSTASRNF